MTKRPSTIVRVIEEDDNDATEQWYVSYMLKGESGTYFSAGPFNSHTLCETALANLATNPAFRGGTIKRWGGDK